MDTSPGALTRALLDAFTTKDRDAAERLIAPDFRFTSPFDNGLDRASYFAICWPASEYLDRFEIVRLLEDETSAAVTYVGHGRNGRRAQNTEVMTCRDGRIVAVEVYFGWSVPHPVAPGRHAEP